MLITVEDALAQGQGVERPITCPVHEDTHASASLNVLKGVWYCYACHSAGGLDAKHVPSAEDLASMLEPEKEPRIYPESYLDLFDSDGYWQSRFPDWVCWYARLGHDPLSGNDTFPVRTPEGLLAGVGLRVTNEAVAAAKEAGTNPSRYRYPYGWSASTTLGGIELIPKSKMLVLVEGYADACSLWEVGIPAVACYGSGLHWPQLEMIHRRGPKVICLGQDMDEAGVRGANRSGAWLKETYDDVRRIVWPANDPAECSPEQRRKAVLASVCGKAYLADRWEQWADAVQREHNSYLLTR